MEQRRPVVTVIGGGMITRTQLLPTLYHMQRQENGGGIGEIRMCALDTKPILEMRRDAALQNGFPGQNFVAFPDPATTKPTESFPELYREVLKSAPKGSIAVVAVPDHFHYSVIKAGLENDLHLCVVKPLVLKHAQAQEIEKMARERGLVVGVDYHKRFDYRNLMARKDYRSGKFGNFRLAQAHLHEPWYYRDSNFQNWCTCENSDMFTYVGCHYVDLVAFITGLRPVSVSVYGIRDKYPNGREGFLWTDARVVWDNGGCLSIANAIGYPNAGAGGNSQGLVIWGQGPKDATLVYHSDQFRGVKHSNIESGSDPGDTIYSEPNPDYFRLLDQGGAGGGLVPVGYGHRSVEYIIDACRQAGAIASLTERQKLIKQFDAEGIMATPANSAYNELVVEAGRLSITNAGREVVIDYGEHPSVRFR